MLEADIELRLSRLSLDVALTVAAGEVVAVLGPNGAGKSTVLRALAGLLRLSGGRVVLGGVTLEDPAKQIRVVPEKRPVAMMFQEYLLFPHLSALENVAFGLRSQGVDRKVARQRATEEMARLGLDGLSAARPGSMSGGQQQRVAMARALVTEPSLLLLDEPLAALDVSTKTDIRRMLRQVLRRATTANVLVTHDLLDAVALADRMIVIENGGVIQSGTPAQVTARPRSKYVADLTGVNLLRGRASGSTVEVDGGGRLAAAGQNSGPVLAVIVPSAVSVYRQRPATPPANLWAGQIAGVDLLGDRVRVRVDAAPPIVAEVTPHAVDELKLDDGGELWVGLEPAGILVYPP